MNESDEAAALAERLRLATLGYFDVLTTYLGQKLGLYEALAGAAP